MAKRISVLLSIAVLLGAILAFGGTSVASAHTVTAAHPAKVSIANSCQDVTAQVELHGYWDNHYYQCSGFHWVNDAIYFFYAGGWSGFMVSGNGPLLFCDGQQWDTFPLSTAVTQIYLSPTREPWC